MDDILLSINKMVVEWKLKDTSDSRWTTSELVLFFSTMFLICMVCHGEFVRLRPDPRHLTEYYLCMSAGGALGGVFVSLGGALHLQDVL